MPDVLRLFAATAFSASTAFANRPEERRLLFSRYEAEAIPPGGGGSGALIKQHASANEGPSEWLGLAAATADLLGPCT